MGSCVSHHHSHHRGGGGGGAGDRYNDTTAIGTTASTNKHNAVHHGHHHKSGDKNATFAASVHRGHGYTASATYPTITGTATTTTMTSITAANRLAPLQKSRATSDTETGPLSIRVDAARSAGGRLSHRNSGGGSSGSLSPYPQLRGNLANGMSASDVMLATPGAWVSSNLSSPAAISSSSSAAASGSIFNGTLSPPAVMATRLNGLNHVHANRHVMDTNQYNDTYSVTHTISHNRSGSGAAMIDDYGAEVTASSDATDSPTPGGRYSSNGSNSSCHTETGLVSPPGASSRRCVVLSTSRQQMVDCVHQRTDIHTPIAATTATPVAISSVTSNTSTVAVTPKASTITRRRLSVNRSLGGNDTCITTAISSLLPSTSSCDTITPIVDDHHDIPPVFTRTVSDDIDPESINASQLWARQSMFVPPSEPVSPSIITTNGSAAQTSRYRSHTTPAPPIVTILPNGSVALPSMLSSSLSSRATLRASNGAHVVAAAHAAGVSVRVHRFSQRQGFQLPPVTNGRRRATAGDTPLGPVLAAALLAASTARAAKAAATSTTSVIALPVVLSTRSNASSNDAFTTSADSLMDGHMMTHHNATNDDAPSTNKDITLPSLTSDGPLYDANTASSSSSHANGSGPGVRAAVAPLHFTWSREHVNRSVPHMTSSSSGAI